MCLSMFLNNKRDLMGFRHLSHQLIELWMSNEHNECKNIPATLLVLLEMWDINTIRNLILFAHFEDIAKICDGWYRPVLFTSLRKLVTQIWRGKPTSEIHKVIVNHKADVFRIVFDIVDECLTKMCFTKMSLR